MTTSVSNDPTKAWPQDRRAELAQLQQLLQEASSLNNASGTLDRLQRIDTLAKALSKFDLDSGRVSFLQFLVGNAHAAAPAEVG